MNSSSYHETNSSRKRTTQNSIEKIHGHDRLESARVPFDQGSRKARKFNACYSVAEILKPLSQWRSIKLPGNKRKLLVRADDARRHIAKLSVQYFNENRMKSAPHPPYSPDLARRTFISSGMPKDVSQVSHSRMQSSFLQQ
jgi:hypothetical protein